MSAPVRVRYIGTPDADDAPCTVFGVTFPKGVWVAVEGRAAAKLVHNRTFEVEAEAAAPAPVPAPAAHARRGRKPH